MGGEPIALSIAALAREKPLAAVSPVVVNK